MRPNRKIIAILVGLSMLVSLLIFASPASAAWYVCQAGRVSEGGVRVRGNYGQLTSVYFINKGSLPAYVFVKEVRWNKTWSGTVLPGQTRRADFNVFGNEPIYHDFLIQGSYASYPPVYNVDSTRCR